MRDEGRKEERSKQGQTNNKVHSTPKAVTFPKKNELPRVGLEPTTLYTLDRALYMYHCATRTYTFAGTHKDREVFQSLQRIVSPDHQPTQTQLATPTPSGSGCLLLLLQLGFEDSDEAIVFRQLLR